MKRWLLLAAFSFVTLLAPVTVLSGVSAAAPVNVFGPCSGAAADSAVCKDAGAQGDSNKNPIVGFIKIIIHIVSIVVGIASVIVLIVSGIRLVTSAGNAQAVATARNGIVYAVVGLFVVALAETLVAFVLNKL